MFVERVRECVASGMAIEEAVRLVRSTSVFTTHTPVPAGHDFFSFAQLEAVAGPVWEQLGVSRESFLALGMLPGDNDNFHMSAVALRLSSRVNGVSRRHGQVSRSLWRDLWPDRPAEAVPVGHVTNGVHLATWMAGPIQHLLTTHLGGDWLRRFADDPSLWDQVLSLDHQKFWIAHRRLKQLLTNFIREDARKRFAGQLKEAAAVVGAGTLIDPDVLVVGFARRFATYKRASLIFRDIERLRRLCTNPHRPVQVIFAGKAHPEDKPGKEVLQEVYRYTRDPRFEGRIAFLEDYDMHLAHLLVQGVDLWLNLPRVPYEASGTSGMKAALNGVPQLSTLDGWWQEGYDGLGGWAISPAGEGEDAEASDAARCYQLLEEQVVPLFYTRDSQGIPLGWVERMRHALRLGGRRFTAHRMVAEYVQEYYVPAVRRDPSGDAPPTA
jgi:starch phosphorylase